MLTVLNAFSRYAGQVLGAPVKTDGATYTLKDIVCVYFKTAVHVKADEEICCNGRIVKPTRGDMLSLIKPHIEKSEILFDYCKNFKSLNGVYIQTANEYRTYNCNEALQFEMF